MLSSSVLDIPQTLAVVKGCWQLAEDELRRVIATKYFALDEEAITQIFVGELGFALREASAQGKIERSFRADLSRRFRLADPAELRGLSADLVADVSLHRRDLETLTGGDFGLTITRPRVRIHGEDSLEITEYNRGMLCQAKLKRRNGQWGRLTNRQKRVLPEHLMYLALLLYHYEDVERRLLRPFQWQHCLGNTMPDLQGWLRTGVFPSCQESSQVIADLGQARIGTDDPVILDRVIKPNKPHLNIRIFWNSPKDWPRKIRLSTSQRKARVLHQHR